MRCLRLVLAQCVMMVFTSCRGEMPRVAPQPRPVATPGRSGPEAPPMVAGVKPTPDMTSGGTGGASGDVSPPPGGEPPSPPRSTAYFVSSSQGQDEYDGVTPVTPWRTFAKLKDVVLRPGDRVFLLRGDVWHSRLTLVGQGTETEWIYVGPYGDLGKPAPEISLANQRDDIGIVVQDLVNRPQVGYLASMGHIHIDNLKISNSRLGIYFRNALDSQPAGFRVTDMHFENITQREVLENLMRRNDALVTQELGMPKGNLDLLVGNVYSETGGGDFEYVFPAAIMFGGRRSAWGPQGEPSPNPRIGFRDIEIRNVVLDGVYHGIVGYYYQIPSFTQFFKNISVKNVQLQRGNTIFAMIGADAGNPARARESRWGVFENLNILSGDPEFAFNLGTTGVIIEDFTNALFTRSSFSHVRNHGFNDGCGFDFEGYDRNVKISDSIFADNNGQAILIMDNRQGNGPHTDLVVERILFYDNLQNVSSSAFRWDVHVSNPGNKEIQLLNNRHVSRRKTGGASTSLINSPNPGGFEWFLGIETLRSFGDKTEGIVERGASFRRDDQLTAFLDEVASLNLAEALRGVFLEQKTPR